MTMDAAWLLSVAAIAQIIAAIFSAITIVQARTTIKQANEERRFQVEPDLEFVGSGAYPQGEQLIFYNAGLGPARNLAISFCSNSDQERPPFFVRVSQDVRYQDVHYEGSQLVPPEYTIYLYLQDLDVELPLDGLLSFTYATRLGETQTTQFHLKLWENEDGRTRCKVLKVPISKR